MKSKAFVSPMVFTTIQKSRVMTVAEQRERQEKRVPKPFSGGDNFLTSVVMKSLHESIQEQIFAPMNDAFEQERNRAINWLKTRG